MKSKFKKMGMLGATTLASALPLATVLACGGNSGLFNSRLGLLSSDISRYDTKNDEKLVLAHTFSASGPQTKALQKIIEVYNKYAKENGEMEFDTNLQRVNGGYGAATASLRKKFNAQDKKTVANVVIDYPDSASIINSYKMSYDFRDFLNEEEQKALKNRFEPVFWSQNEKIGGLKKEGFWTIPISISSMANAVNTPMFAYVINEVKKLYPNAIDPKNSDKINELLDNGKKSPNDINNIKSKWGEMKKENFSFKNNSITDGIFSNWDELIEFAIKAQKGFGIKVNDERSLHLLAFDSPTNIVQMLSYAYSNGDMDKFYVVKDDKTGYVDFKFLEDKDSDNYKNFIKGIELIRKGVESGALWIGGKGSYGSSLLINHEAMVSLGSTAGATHWYTGEDGSWKITGLEGASFKALYDLDSGEKEQVFFSGDEEKIKAQDTIFGSHRNKVLENIESEKAGDYDLVLKQGFTLEKFKETFTNNGFKQLVSTKDKNDQQTLDSDTSNDVLELGSSKKLGKFYAVKTDRKESSVKVQAHYNSQSDKDIYFKGEETTKTHDKTTFSSYNNKFVLFSDSSKASKYDIVLKESFSEEQLKRTLQDKKHLIWVPENEDNKKFINSRGSLFEKIGYKYEVGKKQEGEFYAVKNAISGDDSQIIKRFSKSNSLQAGEVKGINAPSKVSDKENGAVYFQGPSLIPVHANEKEDKALAKFAMWFTSDKKFIFHDEDENKFISKQPITPLAYWLAKAQYITPLKGVFEDGSSTSQAIIEGSQSKGGKYWKGPEIAFNSFKQAYQPGSKTKVLIQPVDDFTSIARNSVTDIVVKSIYTDAHTSGNVATIDEIYEELQTAARRQEII